ncbi:AAA family ATPase [Shewanella algae]|uniref:AAA family ATPase n=1 Tax=Shewanella algae TaxID=38313 RepID=UPI0031F588DD
MAKNRNRTNIPALKQTPKMPKNAIAEKIASITGTKPDSELMDEATPETLERLEALCTELSSLKSQYENDLQSLASERDELERDRTAIKTKQTVIETQKADHQQELRNMEKMRNDLLIKEKRLIQQEESLSLREAEAQAGFVNLHNQSLAKLTAELSNLKEEQRQILEQNRKAIINAQQVIDDERKKQTDTFKGAWDKLRLAQQVQERERAEIEEQQAQLKAKESARASWEDIKKAQLEQQFGDRISELKSELEQIQNYRQRDAKTIQELKGRLSDFAELERTLKQNDMPSVEELFRTMDKLETEVREYRQKLAGRPVAELEGEVEYLKDLKRSLEDQLNERNQELQEANFERNQRATGIMEREQLALKNRSLQQHNDALRLATEQLRREIESLKDMQQGQPTFPELTKMDEELREGSVTQPIPALAEFIDDLQARICQVDPNNPLYFGKDTLRLFMGGLAMSQLHILQGISGTGKTSLAKAFARAVGGQCTVVPVQAGWRDRYDLVGHYNAFEKRFYEKECLHALYKAQTPAFKDRFNVVLLDEMNLSRPEQYFAEFLSALELTGDDRHVVLMENTPAKYPQLLMEGRKIRVADNLWFIGTANHDETTFEFADKTQDRSFVMELGRNDSEGISTTLKRPVVYSVSSMQAAFDTAIKQYRPEVDQLFKVLQEHEITKVLEQRFGIGWGNRLERQARQFIPVVMACGGTPSQALDHLLSTRLFRDGKVTGRYDTKAEHLNKLESCLNDVWEQMFSQEFALKCGERLTQEIERKEMA